MLAFGSALVMGCGGAVTGARAPGGVIATVTTDHALPASTLRIVTFNLGVFGPTKAANPAVLEQLAAVIGQYDVIALQEIRDVSERAPRALLQAINNHGRSFDMRLSPRTGRQADDRESQEQYAVLYDTARLEALPGAKLFDDRGHDLFQREPYLTWLRTRDGAFSFVLISIHTRPARAVAEIGALHDVVEWAKVTYPDEDDFIVLGDFNASCRYASRHELDALEFRGPSYVWLIPDDSDTNVSRSTACAYDRIVLTAGSRPNVTGRWGVDSSAFSDETVSDHWPVWVELTACESPPCQL